MIIYIGTEQETTVTPDDPLTDTEPTTPVSVNTEASTDRTATTTTSMVEPGVTTISMTNTELSSTMADATNMIMSTVNLSTSPLGGAIGGVMGVVLVIIAVTVCVVVLIIFKRHSRQKHEGQSQQNKSIGNAMYGG